MSFMQDDNPYQVGPEVRTAALAEEWERTTFIRRTYTHLAGAIALFVGIEFTIFSVLGVEGVQNVAVPMMTGWNWLIVLGAFMVVSWLAHSWAASATSMTLQYLGLGLYVLAQAVIFLPLLGFAYMVNAAEAIPAAAVMTGVVFSGLTLLVFVTRADFSWLGRYLALACLAAMGLIVVSIFTGGFSLGMLFSAAMVVVAAGYILYDTSNVLHHFRTDQHVVAALALFASVAILFWYILRIMIALSGRD